jgi:hypothetical protein
VIRIFKFDGDKRVIKYFVDHSSLRRFPGFYKDSPEIVGPRPGGNELMWGRMRLDLLPLELSIGLILTLPQLAPGQPPSAYAYNDRIN